MAKCHIGALLWVSFLSIAVFSDDSNDWADVCIEDQQAFASGRVLLQAFYSEERHSLSFSSRDHMQARAHSANVNATASSTAAPATTSALPPYTCSVDPVIPMESESSFCNVDDESRQDCGWLGINEESCESRGCCWRPSEAQGYPWCYCATGGTGQTTATTASTTTTTLPPYSCPLEPVIPMESEGSICDIANTSRQECGWLGIDEETCEGRGCCWRPTGNINGVVPWCFCAAGSSSSTVVGSAAVSTTAAIQASTGVPNTTETEEGNITEAEASTTEGISTTLSASAKLSTDAATASATSASAQLSTGAATASAISTSAPAKVTASRAEESAPAPASATATTTTTSATTLPAAKGSATTTKAGPPEVESRYPYTCAADPVKDINSASEVCAIPEAEREDCGWYGIDQVMCERRGCCFNMNTTGNLSVPHCYCSVASAETTSTTTVASEWKPPKYACMVEPIVNIDHNHPYCKMQPEAVRKDCGWDGIDNETCSERGCCWDDSLGLAVETPRCYCAHVFERPAPLFVDYFNSEDGCLRDESEIFSDALIITFTMRATNLDGTFAIRDDDWLKYAGLHLELIDHLLVLGINGGKPSRQQFQHYFLVDTDYDVSVVYDKFGGTAKLFLFGVLQETLNYEYALRIDMKPGYVGCWDAGGLKNQYEGTLKNFKMTTTLPNTRLTHGGVILVDYFGAQVIRDSAFGQATLAAGCSGGDQYELNSTDTKCSHQNSDRLFRKDNLDVDGCYDECKKTENCNYFSISLTGQYAGVCMGCNAGIASSHTGFDFYTMCADAPPTTTPAPACAGDEQYHENATDTKCANNNGDRLFRKENLDTDGCYEECKKTENCNYFSISLTGQYAGVCMGCTEGVSETHAEFTFYTMCEGTDVASTPAPPAPHCSGDEEYHANATDTKCAHNHPDRLFRMEGLDTDGCYEVCKTWDDCNYFSISMTGQYAGVCMGCTEGVSEPHSEFTFYTMCEGGAAPPPPPPVEACTGDETYHANGTHTKCAHNHPDRLFRKEGLDTDGCYEECKAWDDCNYFSISLTGQYAGVCMGCKDGVSELHAEFDFYTMCEDTGASPAPTTPVSTTTAQAPTPSPTIAAPTTTTTTTAATTTTQAPTPAPTTPAATTTSVSCSGEEEYYLTSTNTKCSHQNSDRLFRKEDLDVNGCYEECKKTENCNYFSISLAGQYAGVCMGCNAGIASPHTGFDFYTMCAGDAEASTVAPATPTPAPPPPPPPSTTTTTTSTPPPYSCPVDPVMPIDSGSFVCHVESDARQECGWLGIDEETCAGRGCCWRPNDMVDGPIPWCFCATGTTTLASTTTTVTTTTTATTTTTTITTTTTTTTVTTTTTTTTTTTQSPYTCPADAVPNIDSSKEICDVPSEDRMDCGWNGIDPATCEARGCCFKTGEPGAPECFCAKADTTTTTTVWQPPPYACRVEPIIGIAHDHPYCALQPEFVRQDCGWDGIDMDTCENRGCCWDDDVEGGDGVPRCYCAKVFALQAPMYVNHFDSTEYEDGCIRDDGELESDSIVVAFEMTARSLDGWFALRDDDGAEHAGLHLEIQDHQLLFTVVDNVPATQKFQYFFDENKEYEISVMYDKNGKTLKLFVDGWLDETLEYTSAETIDMKPGYVGCWDGWKMKFDGVLDHFKITEGPAKFFSTSRGTVLLDYVHFSDHEEASLMELFAVPNSSGHNTTVPSGNASNSSKAIGINTTTLPPVLQNATVAAPGNATTLQPANRNETVAALGITTTLPRAVQNVTAAVPGSTTTLPPVQTGTTGAPAPVATVKPTVATRRSFLRTTKPQTTSLGADVPTTTMPVASTALLTAAPATQTVAGGAVNTETAAPFTTASPATKGAIYSTQALSTTLAVPSATSKKLRAGTTKAGLGTTVVAAGTTKKLTLAKTTTSAAPAFTKVAVSTSVAARETPYSCPADPIESINSSSKICSVVESKRVECGWYGIDRDTCEGRGCCFIPDIVAANPQVPECFCAAANTTTTTTAHIPAYTCEVAPIHPIDHSHPYCTVQNETDRQDCGWPGIDQLQCEDRGCCWDDDVEGGEEIPRCFCAHVYERPSPMYVGFFDSAEGCLRDESSLETDVLIAHFVMASTDLTGYTAIRDDDKWVEGGLHLEVKNHKLLFGVNGAKPSKQQFAYRFLEDINYDVTVVFDKNSSSLKLFLDGWLQEALYYVSPVSISMQPGYVGCWDDGSGSLKRQYQGTLTGFKMLTGPIRLAVTTRGIALLDFVHVTQLSSAGVSVLHQASFGRMSTLLPTTSLATGGTTDRSRSTTVAAVDDAASTVAATASATATTTAADASVADASSTTIAMTAKGTESGSETTGGSDLTATMPAGTTDDAATTAPLTEAAATTAEAGVTGGTTVTLAPTTAITGGTTGAQSEATETEDRYTTGTTTYTGGPGTTGTVDAYAYTCKAEPIIPINSSLSYCTQVTERQECGWEGIDQVTCEERGCCWEAAEGDAPNCFCSMKGKAAPVYIPHFESVEGCLRDNSEVSSEVLVISFKMSAWNLTGWHAIRNDDGWKDGGLHLGIKDHKLRFSIKGLSPAFQEFSYEFQVDTEYRVAVVYEKHPAFGVADAMPTVKMFIGGWLNETLTYDKPIMGVHVAPGYIGCWDNGYGVITRKFAGSLENFKVVTMHPTIIVSEAGSALLESVDLGTIDVEAMANSDGELNKLNRLEQDLDSAVNAAIKK